MKCQSLFSVKNKNIINLSSAESIQRVVKVKVKHAANTDLRLTISPY